MGGSLDETYFRPDFWRPNLQWKSLNGEWDFLFDDEDVGLLSFWQQNGLPGSVITQSTSDENSAPRPETESVTAKIAGDTQKLLQGNLAPRQFSASTHHRRKIVVPYVFQAPASGINERSVHEVLWYERRIEDERTDSQKTKGYRLLVRFGAVDYEATVWVNGRYVGAHRGGHVPFDVDITDAVEAQDSGEHRLTLRVYDSAYDLTQPRGKQYWGAKPESIFYTPSSGIWQNVWLESVPAVRIADSSNGTILRSNDIKGGNLNAEIAILGRRAGSKYSVEIETRYKDSLVSSSGKKDVPKESGSVKIDVRLSLSKEQMISIPTASLLAPYHDDNAWCNGLALWTPEYPQLYDVVIRLFDTEGTLIDEVETITGMRSLDWTTRDGTFRLNGRPFFQALCLDQGYWPESLMTPPSPSALKADIERAKRMGFNGCRKHQKVEDPLFMYWADRLGYLVWGEMANAFQFSDEYVDRFTQEWIEAVKRDINHPCVVTWTPVNESWGYPDLEKSVKQRNHIRALYYLTKTIDPTRPVNDNCGWEHVQTDLTTFHDYADSSALAQTCKSISGILSSKSGRPTFVSPIPGVDPGASHAPKAVIICTEFGGVNIAPENGKENGDEWGYTTAANPEDLLKRVEMLVNAVVDGGHCNGFVWTQLADIEQETNGLYSFDRREKLDSAKVRAVIHNAKKRYQKSLSESASKRQVSK